MTKEEREANKRAKYSDYTKNYSNFDDIGIGGYAFWGDFPFDDFLPNLNYPQAGQVYDEMAKNDAVIGAVIYMMKQLIRKTKWSVKQNGTDEVSRESALFLEQCMHDMDDTWQDFISESLTMIVYGFSICEVIYKIRKGIYDKGNNHSKFEDHKIGWRALAVRSQKTAYGWEINQDTGKVLAFKQMAPPDYQMRVIPIEKCIHFKTEPEYGSPYGRSLLRNAYKSYYFKKRILEIEGIGIERDLAGLPILTPPEGVNIWDGSDPSMRELKHKAEALVKNIRRDEAQGIALPFGWELKLLSTGSQRQFDTNHIINRFNQSIAVSLLADLVMLGTNKVGSFALASVKKSLLSASLETMLEIIRDTINRQEIPRLMKLNGYVDTEKYPELITQEVEVPTLEEMSKILETMHKVGINMTDVNTESFIREIASLPQNSEEVNRIKQQIFDNSLKLKEEMSRTQPIIEGEKDGGGFNK